MCSVVAWGGEVVCVTDGRRPPVGGREVGEAGDTPTAGGGVDAHAVPIMSKIRITRRGAM
ncbi:MAG: hypothetical protein NVSMB42_15120 [Herpetosiphon sp.]